MKYCKNVLIIWKCVFDIISAFATAVDLADKNRQRRNSAQLAKFKMSIDGYQKIFDRSLSKSKDLGDMLRFLPGVVVQKHLSMQGMADLYRVKPDLLERLMKSTIEPLGPPHATYPRYILDDYLSGLLQDQDRSQLYYCDPILQHIHICRHFVSFLDGSNAFDFQS